jgi:hypothetical protein
LTFAHAQPSVSNFTFAQFSTTLTATLSQAPSSGDVVCVGVTYTNSNLITPTPTPTVSDSNNNAYTLSPNSPAVFNGGGSSDVFVYLFYLIAPANATAAITVTFPILGSSGATDMIVDDFTVTGGSAYFDHDAPGFDNSNSTDSITMPSITVPSGELLWFFCNVTSATNAVNSPWTLGALETSIGSATGYILSSSAGSTAVNATQNSAGSYAAVAGAFGPVAPLVLQWQGVEIIG